MRIGLNVIRITAEAERDWQRRMQEPSEDFESQGRRACREGRRRRCQERQARQQEAGAVMKSTPLRPDAELLATINEAVAAANESAQTKVATAQAELVSRSKTVGLLLLEAKKLHPAVKDFEAFLKRVQGLHLSRAYDLLRLAVDAPLTKNSRRKLASASRNPAPIKRSCRSQRLISRSRLSVNNPLMSRKVPLRRWIRQADMTL